MATPRILYCHCAFAQVVPPDVKARVLETLSASACSFDAVPDLCEMSARRDPALAHMARGDVTIVACYPRAVKWLFSAAAAPLQDEARILNMREQTAEEIAVALGTTGGLPGRRSAEREGGGGREAEGPADREAGSHTRADVAV
jgi:hypothetical protein